MLPEELARKKIDKQLNDAGWVIVSRNEYVPSSPMAVKEALMAGNIESDYLLFIEDKAIAVIEAKKEENILGSKVAEQAENYACHPQNWYGLWVPKQIPLVYLANGKKILFKNLLINPDGEYTEIPSMHSPKKMLQLINMTSEYGALPRLEKKGLRDCQYDAEINLEKSFKESKNRALAVLATGSGKTYLACLASYRMLNYTSINRILFLVDRNNLARQTETEFSLFDMTEKQQAMNSLYRINRLRKHEDIKGDIIISTIQKLFVILTGQAIKDEDEDIEDEKLFTFKNMADSEEIIDLGDNLKLPPDYFQFIIVDECHRSIYGKWRSVLNYFKDAKILGLTATPTPEAYAFFNENIIKQYTYDESIVNGVNVRSRAFRIKTKITEHGGTINVGDKVKELNKDTSSFDFYVAKNRFDYHPTLLDRSIINPNQMKMVIKAFRDAIYTDLYPTRKKDWAYIPKTLVFAKNDYHASQLVDIIKEVFSEQFENNSVPEGFVQKITYSAGDSNTLIRDFKTKKNFRIAVTVTLVATGTDIKPLEIVMFMSDIKSDVLYTQMKGRGCRVIRDDKLRELTPNADTKECFYIVDAVGVTEHDKTISKLTPPGGNGIRRINLEQLLERLAHGEVNDDNLALLCDFCAGINRRYEDNPLFERHLDIFTSSFGFTPRALANNINNALSKKLLPPYYEISDLNSERKKLISCLISNIGARKKLLEMYKGYYAVATDNDELLYSDFSKETAHQFIDSFEKYLNDNAQSIEALKIIYNSEDEIITHSMLSDLKENLITESREYTSRNIWNNYKLLDSKGNVEDYELKHNPNALTNFIQISRYAYHKTDKLSSLYTGYKQRFNLYCGQNQRSLNDEQKHIMREIAEYIVIEGAFEPKDLNEFEPDLWKKAMKSFEQDLPMEMINLSKFMLRTKRG